uniref:(northern house mosquito) hypothetical protein n=1 Tax=Culex pipiens TaxID=7175 RepID=A0A8D8FJ33_CULPI
MMIVRAAGQTPRERTGHGRARGSKQRSGTNRMRDASEAWKRLRIGRRTSRRSVRTGIKRREGIGLDRGPNRWRRGRRTNGAIVLVRVAPGRRILKGRTSGATDRARLVRREATRNDRIDHHRRARSGMRKSAARGHPRRVRERKWRTKGETSRNVARDRRAKLARLTRSLEEDHAQTVGIALDR